MELFKVFLAAATCYMCHQMLLMHHVQTCQSSFYGLIFGETAYCKTVSNIVKLLQLAPLAFVHRVIPRVE